MNAVEEKTVKEDFLKWTGGFPPDSSCEIFTYVKVARHKEWDEEEVRLLLKAWMETTWREDVEIEHPADSFTICRRGNER